MLLPIWEILHLLLRLHTHFISAFFSSVRKINAVDQGTTATGIMAPVTNARKLVRNVDVIMSAVKVSSASLVVAGES